MVIVMAAKTATRTDTKAELADRILQFARQQPEDYLLTPERLGRFGEWEVVEPVLGVLLSESEIFEIYDQVYLAGRHSRFGVYLPPEHKIVQAFVKMRGEVAVCSPGDAANMLRMCDQLCVQSTYLTSGHTKYLKVGGRQIKLRHAEPWLLLFGDDVSGLAVRAMDLDGPQSAARSAKHIKKTITSAEWSKLLSDVSNNSKVFPQWVVSALLQPDPDA